MQSKRLRSRVRFVPRPSYGNRSQKNGSLFLTTKQLTNMFYKSRFNRDNLHDLVPGEDIDDSYHYRIYNKTDLIELMALFCEFFEWAINAKNISKVYVTKDLTLERETVLPRVKYATPVDEQHTHGECKAGEYYVTPGRYMWKLWVDGDTFQKMKALQKKDPEILKIREQLIPEMEEKNRNAKRKDKDKPTN